MMKNYSALRASINAQPTTPLPTDNDLRQAQAAYLRSIGDTGAELLSMLAPHQGLSEQDAELMSELRSEARSVFKDVEVVEGIINPHALLPDCDRQSEELEYLVRRSANQSGTANFGTFAQIVSSWQSASAEARRAVNAEDVGDSTGQAISEEIAAACRKSKKKWEPEKPFARDGWGGFWRYPSRAYKLT